MSLKNLENIAYFRKKNYQNEEKINIRNSRSGDELEIICSADDFDQLISITPKYGIVTLTKESLDMITNKFNMGFTNYWLIPLNICQKFFEYSIGDIEIDNTGNLKSAYF